MKKLFILFSLLLCLTTINGQGRYPFYTAPSVSGGGGETSTLLDDIIAYWNMDEASGNIEDEVSTNDGTAASTAPTYSQGGRVGTSIRFNYLPTYGNGTRFDIGDDILQTNQVTVSAWVYPIEDSDDFTILSNSYSTTYGYRLYCGGAGGGVAADADDGTHSQTIDSYPTHTMTGETWNHIVLVIDGTNITLYVNNSQWATASFAYSIGYGSNCSVTIGANANNSNSFGGRIDEVGIWSRALTSDERTELYNSGNGITYPFE